MIEAEDSNFAGRLPIASGQIAKGEIETGVQRFRFSGEMVNVHFADWNGAPAPEFTSTPIVHINYGIGNREGTPSFR